MCDDCKFYLNRDYISPVAIIGLCRIYVLADYLYNTHNPRKRSSRWCRTKMTKENLHIIWHNSFTTHQTSKMATGPTPTGKKLYELLRGLGCVASSERIGEVEEHDNEKYKTRVLPRLFVEDQEFQRRNIQRKNFQRKDFQ